MKRNNIPYMNNKAINILGNLYDVKTILSGLDVLLDTLKKSYDVNVEPYLTAIKTLETIISAVKSGKKALLKRIGKEALHIVTDVIKEIDDSQNNSEKALKMHQEIANASHFLINISDLMDED